MSQTASQNPIVLVHGLNDTARIFRPMMATLKQLGWSVYSLDLLPANGDRELNELAQQLADFIQTALPPSQPFDLVGFSMGGIVSRYYLQRLKGIQRVQRCVTISSPHNGTLTAFATQRAGCIQMRPNSPFLNDLNRDLLLLERINFTSIWTPLDLMIVPARNSQLPVGKDIQVLVPFHPWMVTAPQSIAAVVEALQEPLRHPVSQLGGLNT